MRNSREHAFNYSACLIHARNDDDQFLFDSADGLRRYELTVASTIAQVNTPLRARVKLDDALKLMNPDGAEAFGPV
ncbi:hypothetical protein Pa4123_13600 [Phytohabitans aurantiacus]|uniref:DUF5753 domain-containing protein n=1 Tax=Phytohabitans aurantiacus TaxID=3016789 RepID=A0ABQ5QQC7_9ACTN|nr:hypothetical protein Pa4123_13600 [Phytohabitans aurantiacus]